MEHIKTPFENIGEKDDTSEKLLWNRNNPFLLNSSGQIDREMVRLGIETL